MRTNANWILSVVVLAGACDAGHKAKTEPNNTPTAEAQAKAPAVQARTSATPRAHADGLDWTVNGEQLAADVVPAGDKLVLRVTASGGRTFDAYSMDPGDSHSVQLLGDAVTFMTTKIVGRVPEVGAIDATEAVLVRWDPAQQKPVVANRWSCDESAQNRECVEPAWLQPPSVSDQQAQQLAKQFVEAAARADKQTLTNLFAKTVHFEGNGDGVVPGDTCHGEASDDSSANAADCVSTLLKGTPANDIKKLEVEAVGAISKEALPTSEASRLVHINNEHVKLELVVDLVDGKPLVSAASVFVDYAVEPDTSDRMK